MWDKLQHEMYWNSRIISVFPFSVKDKLQHEMYWNDNVVDFDMTYITDKLQHEMYWNQKWEHSGNRLRIW